ncbi:MAG: di-trans,poly-cis-decaprenylcistransferase [Alphaproteobacteria bacterium]|nr:di-trans,poly-cis-decaprenylcistransferase [Alphaproteobacteria bacterium]
MANIPQHIAFIMDGNSTWAKRNNKSVMDGYLAGMRTMAQTILDAKELGVRYATFYAFSTENWKRPQMWVSDFMSLAMRFFRNDPSVTTVLNAGAKLKVIGDITKLSQELQDILNKYMKETASNTGITVQIAISYGARDEIVRAMKRMSEQNIEFSVDNISQNLDTAGIPDPDLIIRTSSKQRLSNFLLWQASYSELYFSDILWPDFNKSELEKALDEYSRRERTYGK